MPTVDKELMIKADEAKRFLDDHPAVCKGGGDFTEYNFTWWINHVCPNGVARDSYGDPSNLMVDVRRSDPRFESLVDRYKQEDDETDNPFYSVSVPYKDLYGCDWVHAGSHYAGEYSIFKYIGFLKDRKRLDYDKWMAYEGGYLKADSFEELIVKTAEDVKADYGDFKARDFLTAEEKANHDAERPFHIVDYVFNGQKCGKLVDNPKYMSVSDGDLNLRWWKWYEGTEHFKKNWSEEANRG